MKRGFSILLLIATVIVGISCSNSKSYTDYLNDQRDAIQRLIDENGFEILNDYPEDGKFKPNQFVNLNGIYMNVIDSGRGEKAVFGETIVYCRFNVQLFLNDSASYSNFPNREAPMEFTYGKLTIRTELDSYYLSEGIGVPLGFVRDSAEVKLIVPFQYGSQGAQQSYEPMYYDRVRYIFKK